MYQAVTFENNLVDLCLFHSELLGEFYLLYEKNGYQLLALAPKYIYCFDSSCRSLRKYSRESVGVYHETGQTVVDPIQYLNEEIRSHAKTSKSHKKIPFFRGGMVGAGSFEGLSQLLGVEYDSTTVPPLCFALVDTFFVHETEASLLHLVCVEQTAKIANEMTVTINAKAAYIDDECERKTRKFDDFRSEVIKKKELRRNFLSQFNEIQKQLKQGYSFQTVLSIGHSSQHYVDPMMLFSRLRKHNSTYKYIMHFFDNTIVSISPENLFEISPSNEVKMTPLAGTRPRTDDPVKNNLYEEELTSCRKEMAEHAMLVDLSRNDLGMVCEPGSVTVKRYCYLEYYPDVLHLASEVVGSLKEENTAFDVMRAVSPAGTMSGAPKISTIKIIKSIENNERGYYSGNVGIINFDGSADFSVIIRAAIYVKTEVKLRAGAGIVLHSLGEQEFEECIQKMYSCAKEIA